MTDTLAPKTMDCKKTASHLFDLASNFEIQLNDLKSAIIATLNENAHLADGDCCTLKRLKDAVPEWEATR